MFRWSIFLRKINLFSRILQDLDASSGTDATMESREAMPWAGNSRKEAEHWTSPASASHMVSILCTIVREVETCLSTMSSGFQMADYGKRGVVVWLTSTSESQSVVYPQVKNWQIVSRQNSLPRRHTTLWLCSWTQINTPTLNFSLSSLIKKDLDWRQLLNSFTHLP